MVKVEMQRWVTVISGFAPLLVMVGPLLTVLDPLVHLLVVAGPETTKLTSLLGTQAFTGTKIDPYYQRQKCRPMTLVSGDIRFMRIFAEVSWEGRQTKVRLSTTEIFSVFAGYFF